MKKDALVNTPMPFQRALQYEFVQEYDKDFLFRNARFVPLGLTFERYLPERSFLKLSTAAKGQVLLRAVVLSEKTGEKIGLSPAALSDLDEEIRSSSLVDIVGARRKTALELTSFRQSQIEGKVQLDEKCVLRYKRRSTKAGTPGRTARRSRS